MNLTSMKKEADKLLNTTVKVPLINETGAIVMIDLVLTKNKIFKDKNICLSYFKDCSYVVNTATINTEHYTIIKDTSLQGKE